MCWKFFNLCRAKVYCIWIFFRKSKIKFKNALKKCGPRLPKLENVYLNG